MYITKQQIENLKKYTKSKRSLSILSDIETKRRFASPAKIIDCCCKILDVEFKTIKVKSHKRNLAFPRQIIMVFLYERTMLSLKNVGEYFDRDHTTVIHALKTINGLIDVDDYTKDLYEQISKEINKTELKTA